MVFRINNRTGTFDRCFIDHFNVQAGMSCPRDRTLGGG